MLDIILLREQPDLVKKHLELRGQLAKRDQVDFFTKLDAEWRELKQATDTLRAERNKLSEQINTAKKQGQNIDPLIKRVKQIPLTIQQNEEKLQHLDAQRTSILESIPNLVDKSVPHGDATKNKILKTYGKPRKISFPVKGHEELLTNLGLLDLERAAKTAGARFYYLKKELVQLNYALITYALEFLKKKGFTLMQPPYMLHKNALNSAIPLAAFEEMIYKIENEDLYLIGTAEHALNAYYANETLKGQELPIRFAGISTCFRKEAGSHGKDTKGLFRLHQFEKVEQFIFSTPEKSWNEFDFLLKNTTELLTKLGIPVRTVLLASQDMGIVPTKTIDIEGWFPSTKTYRELGSCSHCLDYQARRANIKYDDKGKREYVHTLNNTAIATERAMVCIVENYQEKDGSIKIPKALHKYMGGIKKIQPQKIKKKK